jgi:hypothetical protein
LIVKSNFERDLSGWHTEIQHLFCAQDTELELIGMWGETVAPPELAKQMKSAQGGDSGKFVE